MVQEINKIEFDSLAENMFLVEQFTEEICDSYKIFNSYYGNIDIALTEAVKNAITHGNNNNPKKKVTVIFNPKSYGLSFTVNDEGDGFDFNKIPYPTDFSDEHMEEAGRGLFLIKSLSDEVHFSNGGRTIEIVFHISSINTKTIASRIKHFNNYSSCIKQTFNNN